MRELKLTLLVFLLFSSSLFAQFGRGGDNRFGGSGSFGRGSDVVVVNSAPTIDAISDTTIAEAELLSLTPTASDVDGPIPTLSILNAPAGSNFMDNGDGTGTFTWTPTYSQAGGVYVPSFVASDGVLTDTVTVTITVTEFTPDLIPTLVFWGKSYAGITQAANEISAIADQSGNGNHVTQTVAAQKPDLIADQLNGLSAINFDGNDVLVYSGTGLNMANNVSGFTVSMIIKTTKPGTQTVPYIIGKGTGHPGSSRFLMGREKVASEHVIGGRRLDGDSYQFTSGGSFDANIWSVDTGVIDYANSNAYLYSNGALQASSTSFQTDGNTSNRASVFSGIGGSVNGAQGITGQIVEWVAYSTALDSTNRLKVEAYLNNVAGGLY